MANKELEWKKQGMFAGVRVSSSALCRMVARTCVVLLLAAALCSCRSVPDEARGADEFGPGKILIYALLKDASYGWLGDQPVPASIVPVQYSYSANFKALEKAVDATIAANEEGQKAPPHEAVSAVVTWQWIEQGGFRVVQIRSSQDIQIVDLPAELRKAWQAANLIDVEFDP